MMSETGPGRSAPSYPAGFDIRKPLSSFGLTVYEVLAHPRRFYSRLEAGRSDYPAMAFLYLVGAIAALVAFLADLIAGSTLFYVPFFSGGTGRESPAFVSAGVWEALPEVLFFTFLAPVFLVVVNYLWALLVHALAWFYMGRRAGNVKHTFRVIAYSNAVGLVALVLAAVPFMAPVATVWALYLLVVGVRRLNPRAAGYALGEPAGAARASRGGEVGSAAGRVSQRVRGSRG